MISQSSKIPRHLAIIMDGNNRWAKKHGLDGNLGHKKGAKAVRDTVENCVKAGVEVLTVYAFSSENWRRPEEEVNALMTIFLESLAAEVPMLQDNGVCLRFIGDLSAFSSVLREKMQEAMNETQNNSRMTFAVAVNYGGQWDIAQAARILAEKVAAGEMSASDITPERIQEHISLGDLPPPDLCIRTSNEQRISNFMLWQLAYSELYFPDILWPDFDEAALHEAFRQYASRQRRFGRTSEQIEEAEG
ncbi:MAG: di-trans,poly-cis-decaprenylcistransferase [Moraxellaceae bacterium]|nr:MAG: di-trans,poly-cis-decaprenylcistransferase [Moraxellaceae bacterium]